MAIAAADLDSKRERAFRLLRGELDTDQPIAIQVPEGTEPTPSPPTYPVIQIGGETIVDPKWGRACIACLQPKPWDDFHRDASRKSGRRSRCATCTTAADRDRDHKARVVKAAAKAEVEVKVATEDEARTNALERLAELYPTKFTQLLYSEQVRLGIRKVKEEPRMSDYKPHRSWASTRS